MRRVIILFAFVFLFFPLVSSMILVENNFDEVYNLGEKIELNFSIERVQDAEGFVEVFLDCDGESSIVNKDYSWIEAGVEENFLIEFPLSEEGDCEIKVSFSGEVSKSQEFKISDNIEITYDLNDVGFFPGEEIFISGHAKKRSGEDLEGFIEINLESLTEKVFEVHGGDFSFSFPVVSSISPGEYVLNLEAYDLDVEEHKLNIGRKSLDIEIFPVVSELLILSEEAIEIPSIMNFSVISLNQVGEEILGKNISVKIFDIQNQLVFSKNILGGENLTYEFFSDAPRGGWKINAYYGSIFSTFSFYVQGNEDISISLDENRGVIIFENIGNVPYEGIYSFSISNDSSFQKTISFNLSLGLGEIHEEKIGFSGYYNLTFPEKKYSNILLTGYSINFNDEIDSSSYYISFTILLILFLFWFFGFKKKIFLNFFKQKKNKKQKDISQIPGKKDKHESLAKKKQYLLFIESRENLLAYRQLIEGAGFKLHILNNSVGYILSSGMGIEKKFFVLAKMIKKFGIVKDDFVSISLSSGYFENQPPLLKKFALISRSLLGFSKGKILLTERFVKDLGLKIDGEKKSIEISGRMMNVYII